MELGPLLSLRTEIETVEDNSVLLISISGKITSENIFALNSQLKSIFEEGIYYCILDLSGLEYINSSGIALVLNIQKATKQNHGKLVLTEPSEVVKDVFELTDILPGFEVSPSMELAKKSFINS